MAPELVNRIFLHFSILYGRLWDSTMDDPVFSELKTRQWAKLLPRLSPEQIDKVIERCLVDHPDYPPGAGQFLKLCQPNNAELGIPDLRQAYDDMIYRRWTHEAVWYASERAGGRYTLRTMPESVAFPRFRDAYKAVVEEIKRGAVLEIPGHVALPAPAMNLISGGK